ncbi:hypothetical protein AXG93_4382s1020 [Marchantia polymorpha subsp. ruderalis]|uniref:Uncharacterized protein n=1 Tax=Marchantia polymorpha subsp. ruderalis TaxID=1480154 RepID=A0A176VNX4_MARPO|nr:hypothetical protein AXG93_4382s1020 [Marchantia polymorpha subsp. ruderalis]
MDSIRVSQPSSNHAFNALLRLQSHLSPMMCALATTNEFKVRTGPGELAKPMKAPEKTPCTTATATQQKEHEHEDERKALNDEEASGGREGGGGGLKVQSNVHSPSAQGGPGSKSTGRGRSVGIESETNAIAAEGRFSGPIEGGRCGPASRWISTCRRV